MKPPKYVIKAVIANKSVIPTRDWSNMWRSYRRPEHETYPGTRQFDLVAPDGSEWTVTQSLKPPFPIDVYRV